jgi:hypothetical protein
MVETSVADPEPHYFGGPMCRCGSGLSSDGGSFDNADKLWIGIEKLHKLQHFIAHSIHHSYNSTK